MSLRKSTRQLINKKKKKRKRLIFLFFFDHSAVRWRFSSGWLTYDQMLNTMYCIFFKRANKQLPLSVLPWLPIICGWHRWFTFKLWQMVTIAFYRFVQITSDKYSRTRTRQDLDAISQKGFGKLVHAVEIANLLKISIHIFSERQFLREAWW